MYAAKAKTLSADAALEVEQPDPDALRPSSSAA